MQITTEEIFEEFEQLDPRDQSQYLLELGYDLPRFPPEAKRDCDLVHGCQSQVWLTGSMAESGDDPVLTFQADSDAEIVRGLITILLASYSGLRASEILAFPITDVFDRLRLKQYISPQRHNGLQGMVDRIRTIAAESLAPSVAATVKTKVQDRATADHHSKPASTSIRPFDVDEVRRQFPVLNQILANGRPPVYLDSGASAQKPQVVIDKEREVEEQYFANAYRGRYSFGARIDDELEAARQKIADFIGASASEEVAFVPGATAALNMIAFGWSSGRLQSGDEILITPMEHHANFVPWQQVAHIHGAVLKFIPLTEDGRLDLTSLDQLLTRRTKIVAVTGMSNVLGTVTPIRQLSDAAHAVGAVLVVDGAQSVPHMPTDVVADGIDFLAFSGHKVYGPTGIGVLYGRQSLLSEMQPMMFGGHMISRVYSDHSEWAPPPARFEAGTLPIVQAIALGTAIDWVQQYGLAAIHAHEQRLLELAATELQSIPNMTIYGPSTEHKGAIVSFRMSDIHPEDLAALFDLNNVFTRHGHHCTMPLHDLLGVSATTRASFAAYNTEAEVRILVDSIREARERLLRHSS